MEFEEFKILSEKFNLVPVYEVITADLLTPVLTYLKLREENHQSFLLESVEGSEQLSRYSFIGIRPKRIITNRHDSLDISEHGNSRSINLSVFDYLKESTKRYKQAKPDHLPDFTGGWVGFLGYENISLIEKTTGLLSGDMNLPDSNLGLYDTVLAFDHFKHQIILIHNVEIEPGDDCAESFARAKNVLSDLKNRLNKNAEINTKFKISEEIPAGFDSEEFYKQVADAKDKITNGDIFQLVLSRRFSSPFEGDTFNVYRALRIINPSPYMYYLEFEDDLKIMGTSPEDLLKVKERNVRVRPIAGTRRRGKSSGEEKQLEEDLLTDSKEIAEHTMLLDLGRNDLGKICEYGSVKVTEKMAVQKFSHVMHLVSKVEGKLAEGKDSVDALMSCFPAGTVTGAPKISAISHIKRLENADRNIYAGAVGYLDYSGNLDMCIAIRTLFAKGNIIYWQSGAGIVADSKPELEVKEIINKSGSMVNALKFAGEINENLSNR